jgi:hypothetical protein
MGWNINRALLQPLAHMAHERIMPVHLQLRIKKESAVMRPFSGIRVLELGNLLAGVELPATTLAIADEVVE